MPYLLLPLTKDRATELFREDVSVYQLHADGSETLVEDRAALQGHDGLFGVEKSDWNAYLEYQSMKQELEDLQNFCCFLHDRRFFRSDFR